MNYEIERELIKDGIKQAIKTDNDSLLLDLKQELTYINRRIKEVKK